MATNGRTRNLSDEERQRRSELARKLHNQVVDPSTGRRAFGGPQPGSGRPRKPRAAEVLAEEARKNQDLIVAAFKDALSPNQPVAVRVRAAERWIKIEHDEAALQNVENRELASLSQEELVDIVAAGFVRLAGTSALDSTLSSITGSRVIEGEVVEYDDTEVIEIGDDPPAAA